VSARAGEAVRPLLRRIGECLGDRVGKALRISRGPDQSLLRERAEVGQVRRHHGEAGGQVLPELERKARAGMGVVEKGDECHLAVPQKRGGRGRDRGRHVGSAQSLPESGAATSPARRADQEELELRAGAGHRQQELEVDPIGGEVPHVDGARRGEAAELAGLGKLLRHRAPEELDVRRVRRQLDVRPLRAQPFGEGRARGEDEVRAPQHAALQLVHPGRVDSGIPGIAVHAVVDDQARIEGVRGPQVGGKKGPENGVLEAEASRRAGGGTADPRIGERAGPSPTPGSARGRGPQVGRHRRTPPKSWLAGACGRGREVLNGGVVTTP
jgi:hypothetical protein